MALRSDNSFKAPAVCGLDFVQGPLGVARRRPSLALPMIRCPAFLARSAALLDHLADLFLGVGQLFLVLGQKLPCLPVVLLGLGHLVGDAPLAFVEPLRDRSPGKLAQHEKQQQEDDRRPDGQVRFPTAQRIEGASPFFSPAFSPAAGRHGRLRQDTQQQNSQGRRQQAGLSQFG